MNKDLCLEIKENNDYLTDYILSLLNVIFPQISQKDNIINTTYPKTYNVYVSPSTTCAIPENTAGVKLQDKSTNKKEKTFRSKTNQKNDFIYINTPLFNTFSVCIPSSPTQLCAPIYTKFSSPSPKNKTYVSPI